MTVALAVLAIAPSAAQARDSCGPAAPDYLEVLRREEDLGMRITLSWRHRSDCFGYRVYRSHASSGDYLCVGGISAATMTDYPFFLDDTIKAGETYYYRVSAIDDHWREGPKSEPLEVKTGRFRRTAATTKSMLCSLADQRVYCFENGVVVNILRCSTGAGGATPTGNYSIYSHRGSVGGSGYVCTYWMDWKPNYGMHAWPRYSNGYRDYEESLGVRPRSHGCIRLHPLEAYWPYYWAPDGTPFTVIYGSYSGLPFQGACSSEGCTEPSKTWYFAEGYSGDSFREFLLLFNPGINPANVVATYYPEAGQPVVEHYLLPAGSRRTIYVNEVQWLARTGHSIKIESDEGIVAAKTEFFDHNQKRGGSLDPGVTEPSRDWYFAEGYTGPGFDTYILLFNQNSKPVETSVTYYPEGAAPVETRYLLPALSRWTVPVNQVLDGWSLSARVSAEMPVVAEQTVYFSRGSIPNGVNGGNCSQGLAEPSGTWYLAEGCTGDLFDEYILVLNPSTDTATVNMEFCTSNGRRGYQAFVPPLSRTTISVDSIPGLESADTAARIESDKDIVVERAMYYWRDSRRGGHASNGVARPSRDWYFAEGCTSGTFDEYILVFNPTDEGTVVQFTFHTEDGRTIGCVYGVAAKSRFTLHADEIPGVEWTGNSVQVHADRPVVAEQAEYFCIPR